MTKMLAFVAALLMSALAVSSACVANSVQPLQFTIEPTGSPGLFQVRFRRADSRGVDSWSSSFRAGELAGLDPASLRGSAIQPVRFTISREPGRIDCAGNGGGSMASGTCRMTPDEGFNALLASNGIARPTEEQTYGLIATDVKRELITALKSGGYPTPSIDKLMELSAVDVTAGYIRELAAHGYRPHSLQSLVEFAALEITPDYIGSFARIGYSNLEPSELVQLKALEITPEYVAGFQRLGYRDLPVSKLIELKAMNVTPEFVRAVQQGGPLPSPDRLVQIRAVTSDLRNDR